MRETRGILTTTLASDASTAPVPAKSMVIFPWAASVAAEATADPLENAPPITLTT
jgi:hypothetical protein